MVKRIRYFTLLPVYIVVLVAFLLLAIGGSRAVTVLSENAPIINRKVVVIDPGHGGVDGGATSVTGVLESQLNLEIALRLNDLMHLLGIDTVMIRQTDCSVYTEGETIAQKKVSDLKQRVRVVNNTPNATLVSIHQNLFVDEMYSGAQVFYAPTQGSQDLAKQMQTAFIHTINPESNRKSKKAESIYLMQHIHCPGILIECGFISNHQEEAKLRNPEYQKQLCAVIASVLSSFLNS